MKTMRNCLVGPVAALLAVNGLSSAAAGPTVWDLAGDWSDTQNPNGPWSYNAGANPIPTNFPNWAGSGNPAWVAAPSGFGHIPAWAKLQVETSCDAQIGDVYMHANDATSGTDVDLANVTWTSPASGVAAISGTLWWYPSGCGHAGRTMDWRLYFNGVLMDSGNIGDGDPWSSCTPRTFGFVENLSPGDIVKLEFERTHVFGTMATVALKVTMPPVAVCPHDLDGDGLVGINDFLDLLAQWGNCGAADFDADGVVGINDFLELLANWGPCP